MSCPIEGLEDCDWVGEEWVNPRWKKRWTNGFTLVQGERKARFVLHGLRDDGRAYVVWFWVKPEEEQKELLKSKVLNALFTLDTYLDPRCECVPGPGGTVGAPCKFHGGGDLEAEDVGTGNAKD